jgi:carbon storage regulator CsrA
LSFFFFSAPSSARGVHTIPPLLISAKVLSFTKECAMLVLTRKLEEQIRIGDDITISILRVKGNTVRVGIDAPREIRVVRGELRSHVQGDTSSCNAETTSVDVPESSSLEDGPVIGEAEQADPATTAVRQFIASRARRQNRRPQCHQPGSKPLAATLTRSA